MHDTSVDKAIEIICTHARSEQLQISDRSHKAAEDFILAADVNLALVDAGYDHDVVAYDGQVTVTINSNIERLKHHEQEITGIAEKIKGMTGIKIKIGPDFHVPSVNPWSNVEGPPKILLVDDEKDFVHTLSERLETRDLESSVVYDGEQALEFVKKDETDVMVLDLMMPGIDGLEVLQRVKKDYPYIEVIILTGHGSDRERSLADEYGAFAYLQKPIGIDELARVMKDAYQKVNRTRASMNRGESDSD
jgi:two-component system, OmpR family, response regulator CpxR